MLPQIHLNFGPTAFDRVYQIALPLVPGSVFVGGLLLARSDLVTKVQAATGFGPHVVPIILGIGTYACGLMLFGLSAIITGTASGIAQNLAFRSWAPIRGSYLLSQCTVWRKVALEFLGALAPVPPENPPAVSLIEKINQGMKEVRDRLKHDELWEEWYRILQDYLLRDSQLLASDQMFLWIGLEAIGWAVLTLSFFTPYVRHWPLYGIAAIFILFGAFLPFLVLLGYVGSERLSYWDFTAKLLAEIKKRETDAGQSPTPAEDGSLGKRILDAVLGRTKSNPGMKE